MGKSKRRNQTKEYIYDNTILPTAVVRWEKSVYLKKRKWAELSSDIVLLIFQKLDAITILTKVIYICRDWFALARNEPLLWRKVDMTCYGNKLAPNYLQYMACTAVDWSAGQLEEFSVEEFGDYNLLNYIAESTSNLKSISLIKCPLRNLDEEFVKFIKRWQLLEEIEFTRLWCSPNLCRIIGQSCPRLKCFRFNKIYIECPEYEDDEKNSIAKCVGHTMHGLCSLQLIGSRSGPKLLFHNYIYHRMTNKGLLAILEGCPQLESLDIRNCLCLIIDHNIQKKLERIKNLRLPRESTDDYKFARYVFRLFCTCCDWSYRSENSSDNDRTSDYDSGSDSATNDCLDITNGDVRFRDWRLRGKRGVIKYSFSLR